MSGRAILRPFVPGDLEIIIDYLAAQSPESADRFADSFDVTVRELAQMPGMGGLKLFRSARLADMRSRAIRGFPSYLILYRVVDVGIEVFGVLHGARDIEAILMERL